ncbi:MAG TPA: ABC transporter permease [Clostridia bacterium]|nr:ABC transporter permease [Clostridia bacterium]
MVINKMIKRTIFEYKSQYIGSIILIIISCMLYSSFNIAMLDVQDNLNTFRINNKLEDASFIIQNSITNINQLEEKYDLILEERKSIDYTNEDKSVLRILESTNKIDKYAVISGNPIIGENELLIDKGYAGAHSLAINAQLKINDTTFKIVGYMSTPDYVYPLKSESDMLKSPKSFGVAVVSEKDINKIGKGLNFYSVKFNKDNISEFKSDLSTDNILIQWINKKDNNRISFIDGDMKGGAAIGKVMPIAILILTCILISVVLLRLLKREYLVIGTLYAIGCTKKELVRHYLRYPIIISLIGSFVGTIIGSLLVKPLLSAVTVYYNLPLLIVNFDIKYTILSLILPFIFLIPVTYIVINKALKLSPLQLMRGGNNKTKVSFIERKLNLNRFNFNTKFKIRELCRSLPRAVLMILGVTFASMLLLIGFATKDSMNYMVNNSYSDIYKYNYEYNFNALQIGKVDKGEKRSLSSFTTKLNSKDEDLIIYGVEKDSKLINLVDKNNNVIGFDKVIITKSMSDRYNLKIGQSIKVKNKLNSKEYTIKVDEIAKAYTGNIIYMPLSEFNISNGYPENSYLQIDSAYKLDIPADSLISQTSKKDIIDGYNTMLMPMKYMIGGIAVMAFIIGLIVIYVVTSLVIEENKANISMFKILGYKNKEIYSLILSSNIILVILGYIISIPLIIMSVASFFDVMTKDMNITIPAKLNISSVLISFVIIIITYEISKALNKSKVMKISMADSLKEKRE